jgi:hypothetical protein
LDPNFLGKVERAEQNVILYSAWPADWGCGYLGSLSHFPLGTCFVADVSSERCYLPATRLG